MKRSSPLFLLILAALLLWQCSKNTSDLPPVDNEPDTTSHSFTWTLDTVGTYGSVLFDVAIINENDIWAVGEIHTTETDTFDSLGSWVPPYNAVHWNGSEWELMRIFYIFNGQPFFHPLKFTFSFENGEIWFGGNGIVKWDSQQFSNIEIPQSAWGPVAINKAWGLSADKVYIVGDNGHIAHYNGSSWQKLESGTEVAVQDIWGVWNPQSSEQEILCIASNKFQNEGKRLLRIKDGLTIETLPDSGLSWSLSSVWFVAGEKYYVAGAGIYQKTNLNTTNQWERYPPGEVTSFFTNSIRGNAANDIFAVGAFGEIVHYNGQTWQNYFTATQLATGGYFGVDIKGDLVVSVGQLFNQGIIAVGKRQ